ncbi:MAG: ParB/RepB/Spo0J family partition protein [Candidatus Rokubacteria bacterium]|nr:ParB/RepB/Spo0J family partition protein [Candidatus Rokubacteria bacterium]
MIRELPTEDVYPNPDQPRKLFDEAKLHELAASIREHGLLQPITVRPDGAGRYMVVLGERRWRAHLLAGLDTIPANVAEGMTDAALAEQAIVENLQRVDITPLEEARAFQAMLEKGYTVETLARRLGLKQPWRIGERTAILRLRPEYQELLAKGQITPSQATELARLSHPNQDRLFRLIKAGRCETYSALRAAANGLLEAESQGEMFAAPKPSEEERRALGRLEARIEQVRKVLAGGFKDGEVVIARRIAPDRAATMAEELALIRRHLHELEKALRHGAAQAELVA